MRFHKPFDDVQWDAAARAYAQMRVNLRRLRQDHPPRLVDEAELLKQYRDIVQEFGRELQKPRDRINAEKLNDLNGEAVIAFVLYMEIRGPVEWND